MVVMDFSGIYEREHFLEGISVSRIDVRGLSGCSCYCDEEAMGVLREKIREFSPGGMHFLDSGNYHYMSLLWMEKIAEPFRLAVFDNHTDMQPPAFGGILSCGGWIAEALEKLPFLREVILCGPDEEAFAQVPEAWKRKVRFLSRETRDSWEETLAELPADLPVYLSIDKDVLCKEEACTTWSQGELTRKELLRCLAVLCTRLAAKGQSVIGVDICGECDPDQAEGSEKNDASNRALLEFFGI